MNYLLPTNILNDLKMKSLETRNLSLLHHSLTPRHPIPHIVSTTIPNRCDKRCKQSHNRNSVPHVRHDPGPPIGSKFRYHSPPVRPPLPRVRKRNLQRTEHGVMHCAALPDSSLPYRPGRNCVKPSSPTPNTADGDAHTRSSGNIKRTEINTDTECRRLREMFETCLIVGVGGACPFASFGQKKAERRTRRTVCGGFLGGGWGFIVAKGERLFHCSRRNVVCISCDAIDLPTWVRLTCCTLFVCLCGWV